MRPFVFINAAISMDGKISTFERKQTKISSEKDLDRRDSLRAESDAIIVGIGTILADNPSLTVKSERRREKRKKEGKDENPLRVVADSKARIPLDSEVLRKGEGKKLIAVSEGADSRKVEALKNIKGTEVVVCGRERVDLERLLSILWERGVKKLMVEGGSRLNWSFISQGLVDEIYVYVGNLIIGGEKAPSLFGGKGFDRKSAVELKLLDVEKDEKGILLRWRVVK